MGGQPLGWDIGKLVRVAGAAQANIGIGPLHPAALEIGDASDQLLVAIREQRALEIRRGELHLRKGAGSHRVFVDGEGERERFQLHHRNQESIAGPGARRVVDQDLAKL